MESWRCTSHYLLDTTARDVAWDYGGAYDLDLHVALVGPSSGKSSSVAVAKQAMAVTPERGVTLGSGEGIAKQYAYRNNRAKRLRRLQTALLFTDTEIESVRHWRNVELVVDESMAEDLHWGATHFGYADPSTASPSLI